MTDIDLDKAILSDLPPESSDDDVPAKTRKPRSDKGVPRGTRASGGRPSKSTSLKKLADDLLVPWGMLWAGASMSTPTLSAVMLARGEKTVDAVVSMAAEHPRMLKALQRGAKLGPATVIAETLFTGIIAAGMDFGRIPPDSPVGMATGLSEVYAQTHQPLDAQDIPNHADFPPDFAVPPNMMPFPRQPGMPG